MTTNFLAAIIAVGCAIGVIHPRAGLLTIVVMILSVAYGWGLVR